MIRRLIALGLLSALLLPLVAGTAEAAPPSTRRVLVLSMPTLEWADLHQGNTPVLDRLLDDSAVASLSVRSVVRRTSPEDAYATFNAGTRARGVESSGQVLEPDEDFFGVPAGAVFRRNTGKAPGEGVVSLALPELISRNAGLDYDAEIGALGQALEDAKVPRAVIANADGRYALGAPTFNREGGSSLMDKDGVVPAGAVSDALVTEDPLAPFGVAFDPAAVVAAFTDAWAAGGVVMLEGSDLARADRYRPLATPDQRVRLREDALRRTDALVGQLLEQVDLDKDAVLVVAPYHTMGSVHVTVAGLHEPGVAPGLLRSASTRRAGFVTLVDVAPTILELAGVDRPDSMEGRPFERADGPVERGAAQIHDFPQVDRASLFRDRMVVPVAGLFIGLQAILLVAAAIAISLGNERARKGVVLAALALLVYLPATYLAGAVAFESRPDLDYWIFVLGIATLGGVFAYLAGRRSPLDALLIALVAVFGFLVIDMLRGAPLQLNTVFGYSPTVGGRFAGMGNLAYGQFAGAAFLLCGLLLRRLAGRAYCVPVALGVLGLAIIIDGAPMWGSDVGGVLAFVPAAGLTMARVYGWRIRVRTVALWGVLTMAVIAVFAAIDLSRPADSRTHLGRLVESVGSEGIGSLVTVMSRKLGANLGVITSSVWTAMVPIALAFIVYLIWRAPGRIRAVRDLLPETLGSLAVVGFLGFALNDSGIAVPGIMLGVVNAALVYLTVRVAELPPGAIPVPAAVPASSAEDP